jgi:tRNA (cmo5U34)-methyltransferase
MDRQEAERHIVFELMAKLVPAEPDAHLRILDIGCGYGPVATVCLDALPNSTAIGLDISEAMMEAGRPRMARFGDRFEYVLGDFAEGLLPQNAIASGPYDLIVSARAIHHLPANLMASLYASIYGALKPGGAFFNLDTASADGDFLEDLMRSVRRKENGPRETPRTRSAQQTAHDAMHHHKDATLLKHMEWLQAAGFTHVDCFWKRLTSALVGGYKV